MMKTYGYAALDATSMLVPFEFTRRNVGAYDVLIDILYCGVCHSDIHQARNEWGDSMYPMVPGHEIVGRVMCVGSSVTRFKEGDIAGVGCLVDSCQHCQNCANNLEQFCDAGASYSYNSFEQDKKTPTMGGYARSIVTNEKFVLRIAQQTQLERVAPLLCAGITTYSPLRYLNVQAGSRVGVMGLGGLGHMALKLAKSMGAHVTLFTTSEHKIEKAKALGADDVVVTTSGTSRVSAPLDLMINTLSVHTYSINYYLNQLKLDGTMAIVGLPSESISMHLGSLIAPRRHMMGSLIGGIAETQEMLDYCVQHNVLADVEVIPIQSINQAYERILCNDVFYRFVIDMSSLQAMP